MGSLFRRCESGAALRSVGGRGVEKIRKKRMRTFGTWCDQATRGLFPGKRRITWKELYHHMAEKRDRYVKMGFEYTAAENKVYEDMGDPKEVAKLP